MMMKILASLAILALITVGFALDASPMNPDPGEKVMITGFAKPGEAVRLSSSFDLDLPVVAGRYEYVANGVEIPQKPNRFSVTARNIEDLNVGIKMGIWLNMPIKASGGTASVSRADVPPGRYTLKMFGNAKEGASDVSVSVSAETTVYADSDGSYKLAIDTTGIPEGDYRVRGAGDLIVLGIGADHGVASLPSSSEVRVEDRAVSTASPMSTEAEKSPDEAKPDQVIEEVAEIEPEESVYSAAATDEAAGEVVEEVAEPVEKERIDQDQASLNITENATWPIEDTVEEKGIFGKILDRIFGILELVAT